MPLLGLGPCAAEIPARKDFARKLLLSEEEHVNSK